jgi:hypothetical protein
VAGDNSFDPWKRFDKSGGHFGPLELGGSQHECSHLRRRNRRAFGDAVPNAIIFREHNPAALADFKKPIFVFSVRGKVVVVDLDGLADLPQRLSDDLPTERTVDEEN